MFIKDTFTSLYMHMYIVHNSALLLYTIMCHSMVLCQNLPDSNAMLLPSSTTKHALWELYLQAAASSSMRAVAYPTFTQLWRQLLPNVVVMKPMSDLCWVCQQNSTAIMRAANRPEEKSTVSIHANVAV